MRTNLRLDRKVHRDMGRLRRRALAAEAEVRVLRARNAELQHKCCALGGQVNVQSGMLRVAHKVNSALQDHLRVVKGVQARVFPNARPDISAIKPLRELVFYFQHHRQKGHTRAALRGLEHPGAVYVTHNRQYARDLARSVRTAPGQILSVGDLIDMGHPKEGAVVVDHFVWASLVDSAMSYMEGEIDLLSVLVERLETELFTLKPWRRGSKEEDCLARV